FGKPLQNLPGAEEVLIAGSLPSGYPNEFDALFTMECPDAERAGFPILPGPVINIDHHLGNTMYGEVNYVDLAAPSVGEMVWQLNQVLGVPLDARIATAMYVSLAADTGFFRFSNTTQRAFEAALAMVRAGANPGEISLWLNESSTPASIKLLGLCLSTLRLTADGKIASIELPKRFYDEAGAAPEDAEGIVNYGRTIDTVLVSALFKEVDGRTTRVSMRAKPGVDTQAVAARFGGGGHKAASGCTISLPMDEAKEKLLGILTHVIESPSDVRRKDL
ncbi:MAG TPA: bifunctional oligoribonuclease/PAP phosphatase NrnA, partial [Thermoanaerobaculia bacterium]